MQRRCLYKVDLPTCLGPVNKIALLFWDLRSTTFSICLFIEYIAGSFLG